MSSQKKKLPYLLPVENAEQCALIVELFQKSAAGAQSAHVLAALWAKVQLCAHYFESDLPKPK